MRFTLISNVRVSLHDYLVELKVSIKLSNLRDSTIFKIHSTVLTTNIFYQQKTASILLEVTSCKGT
jgi:hypothetical protein